MWNYHTALSLDRNNRMLWTYLRRLAHRDPARFGGEPDRYLFELAMKIQSWMVCVHIVCSAKVQPKERQRCCDSFYSWGKPRSLLLSVSTRRPLAWPKTLQAIPPICWEFLKSLPLIRKMFRGKLKCIFSGLQSLVMMLLLRAKVAASPRKPERSDLNRTRSHARCLECCRTDYRDAVALSSQNPEPTNGAPYA